MVGARVVALLESESGRDAAELAARLRPSQTTQTDRAGRYQLGELSPGSYALAATAPGRTAGLQSHVVVLPGEPQRGLDLIVGGQGFVVAGTVGDAGAGAIAGATIRAVTLPAEGETATLYEVMTDARGAFAVQLPVAAYRLTAVAAGYGPASAAVMPGARTPIDLRLGPAGSVRGRVVDGVGGGPAAGMTISARPFSGPGAEREAFTVAAAADGHFELRDLPPGQYRLQASGRARLGEARAPITITAGPVADEVEIAVERAAEVVGRVHDESGRPLAGRSPALAEGPALERGGLALHPLGRRRQLPFRRRGAWRAGPAGRGAGPRAPRARSHGGRR